jgi:uncharacterized membrane protein YhiD involved in acid resistance
MLQDIQNIWNFSVTFNDIASNLLIALISASIIAFFYRISNNGQSYSSQFISSLILLSLVTSLVIMVIGNNLARAFGLVGAMSIIRFRSSIKETIDIVFIFFALVIGMASGVKLYSIAIFGSVFIGVISWVLSKSSKIFMKRKDFLLEFTYDTIAEQNTKPSYLQLINEYCKKNLLINMKSTGIGEIFSYSFYVNLKDEDDYTEFLKKFKNSEGIKDVNIFFDNEDI